MNTLPHEIVHDIIQYLPRESPLLLVSKAFKAATTRHLYRYVSFTSSLSFLNFCETVSDPRNEDAVRAVRKIVIKVDKQSRRGRYAPFSDNDKLKIGSALHLLFPYLVGLELGCENTEAARDIINCIPDEDIPRLQDFEYTFQITMDGITKIIRKNADHLKRLRILDIDYSLRNNEEPAPLPNLMSPVYMPKLLTLAVTPNTAPLFFPGHPFRDLELNITCKYHTRNLNAAFNAFSHWHVGSHPSSFIFVNRHKQRPIWLSSCLPSIAESLPNIKQLSLSMTFSVIKAAHPQFEGFLSRMKKLKQFRLNVELPENKNTDTQPTNNQLDEELARIEQWGNSCDSLQKYNNGGVEWERYKFERQDIWLPNIYSSHTRPVVLLWMQRHSRYDGLFTLVDSFDPKFDPKSLEGECFSAFSETVQRLGE